MQPRGGLYKINGQWIHGNGTKPLTNPEPGKPTMTEEQYRDLVEYAISLQSDESKP